ncbi:MAG: host-nuclease inhibitor Gam family protein [Anaerovoracaceae bacterium]
MTTHLADTRALTLTDGEKLLERIAHAQIRIVQEEAKQEAAIARAKSRCAANTAVDRATVGSLEKQLTTLILANPQWFRRPRKHQTSFGSFGLEKATRIEIDDAARVIEWAHKHGYDDCVRTTHRPEKPARRARIEAGEDVPGATLLTGDIAKYAIDRTLLDAAAESVAE